MEYVFGTKYDQEVLKTKGDEHSDLTGYQQLVRHYPDQDITDSFRIVEKTNSAEDDEGNCYDWYVIDHHYRFTDKFTPQIGETEQEITDVEIELMEHEQAITDNEIAIMELQEQLNA